MSGATDTKTVEMRFDNSNFESNVKQSMSTLDKLKTSLKLKGASKGLNDVEKSSSKVKFKGLNDSLSKTEKHFSALESIATGVFMRIGMKVADDQTSAGAAASVGRRFPPHCSPYPE